LHRRSQRPGNPLPLPRQQNPDPLDPATGNNHPRKLTNGQDTWRARYAETHTPGSEGGPGFARSSAELKGLRGELKGVRACLGVCVLGFVVDLGVVVRRG
ncbi:MAG: hypothetical protein JWM45_2182, partial [Pseudonocardiales bacterium]|nr:hypothetical protein [Pseudonocardiales bacterium]